MRSQGSRIKMLISADHHLLVRSVDLDHVERRTGRHAQSLALADREIVNAAVLADHFAVCSYQLTRSVGQSFALIGKIGIDKALIIAAWDEADFLRIRLLG